MIIPVIINVVYRFTSRLVCNKWFVFHKAFGITITKMYYLQIWPHSKGTNS